MKNSKLGLFDEVIGKIKIETALNNPFQIEQVLL